MTTYKLEIVGYKGKSLLAKIINVFSPKYSHVAMIINDLKVTDTDKKRCVSYRDLDWSIDQYDVVKKFYLNDIEYSIFRQYIKNKIKVKYSKWENIRYIVKRISGIILPDDLSKPNCVEYAQEALVLLKKIPFEEKYIVRDPDDFVSYITEV